MEQNNLKKGAGFLSEIGIVLRRDGYDTSVPDNGLLPVSADGLPSAGSAKPAASDTGTRISEAWSVKLRCMK